MSREGEDAADEDEASSAATDPPDGASDSPAVTADSPADTGDSPADGHQPAETDADVALGNGAGSPFPNDGAAESEPDVDSLLDELEDLERTVDDPHEREQVRRTIRIARRIPGNGVFGEQIQKYTTRDVAEAFVGSILISLPMLVEDGVFDTGDHFVANPAFFVANALFVVIMTIGLLYWADIQEVQITNPIFGFVPRRLVGVLTIAAFTAAFTMTLWGRVDWSEPWPAVCYVSVVWSAAAFGGALGDILPGESEGADISED